MSLPDGFRLPGDRADLERRVTAWSRSAGLPEGWLRRYIASSVVLAMLGRARDAGGNELFIAKGGASMQLRFGTDARLTRDLDAAFRGGEPGIARALTAAFAEPLWEFTAKARELDPFDGDRLHALVHRHRIALAFRGRCHRPCSPRQTLGRSTSTTSCCSRGHLRETDHIKRSSARQAPKSLIDRAGGHLTT